MESFLFWQSVFFGFLGVAQVIMWCVRLMNENLKSGHMWWPAIVGLLYFLMDPIIATIYAKDTVWNFSQTLFFIICVLQWLFLFAKMTFVPDMSWYKTFAPTIGLIIFFITMTLFGKWVYGDQGD